MRPSRLNVPSRCRPCCAKTRSRIVLPLRLIRCVAVLVLCAGTVPAAEYPFVFRDVGDETGAFPALAGIRGHGAAWGDVDGDGFPSLFVGTFHNSGSKPGML